MVDKRDKTGAGVGGGGGGKGGGGAGNRPRSVGIEKSGASRHMQSSQGTNVGGSGAAAGNYQVNGSHDTVEARLSDRLSQLYISALGSIVRVQNKKGEWWEGVFHTNHPESGGVILKAVYKDGDDRGLTAPREKVRIDAQDFVQMIAKDIELVSASKLHMVQGFATDTEISGGFDTKNERMLVPFQLDSESQHKASLDDHSEGQTWDQFKTNEQRFGVKSTFDPDIYTTKLDHSKLTPEQIEHAARVAESIEKDAKRATGGKFRSADETEAAGDDIGDEWASDVRAPDGSARGSYHRDNQRDREPAASLPRPSDKAYKPPGARGNAWGQGTLADKLKKSDAPPAPPAASEPSKEAAVAPAAAAAPTAPGATAGPASGSAPPMASGDAASRTGAIKAAANGSSQGEGRSSPLQAAATAAAASASPTNAASNASAAAAPTAGSPSAESDELSYHRLGQKTQIWSCEATQASKAQEHKDQRRQVMAVGLQSGKNASISSARPQPGKVSQNVIALSPEIARPKVEESQLQAAAEFKEKQNQGSEMQAVVQQLKKDQKDLAAKSPKTKPTKPSSGQEEPAKLELSQDAKKKEESPAPKTNTFLKVVNAVEFVPGQGSSAGGSFNPNGAGFNPMGGTGADVVGVGAGGHAGGMMGHNMMGKGGEMDDMMGAQGAPGGGMMMPGMGIPPGGLVHMMMPQFMPVMPVEGMPPGMQYAGPPGPPMQGFVPPMQPLMAQAPFPALGQGGIPMSMARGMRPVVIPVGGMPLMPGGQPMHGVHPMMGMAGRGYVPNRGAGGMGGQSG